MEIEFVNMPTGRGFDGELLQHLLLVSQTLSGVSCRMTILPIMEEKSKVHVTVSDIPERVDGYNRRRLARQILWLLHCHNLDEGADVHFMGINSDGYFTNNDFPEILERAHPSVK